jgi:CBS domain-containing protein
MLKNDRADQPDQPDRADRADRADEAGQTDEADGKDHRRVAHVRHPILRLEVLHPNGSRRAEHRVFCRYQKKSVPVGICCACVHCDSIDVASPSPSSSSSSLASCLTSSPSSVPPRANAPSVNCTITVDVEDTLPDPLGVRTEVGVVLRQGTLVLDPASTLKQALDLLRSEDRRSLPVVNADTSIAGVIHEAAFLPGRHSSKHPEDAVAHAMSGSLAIHEAVPIRRALEMLAAAHLREATVVDSDGVPIGVFRDIDGLRWLYSARTAELPTI